MLPFLHRHWFLVSLSIILAAGLMLGGSGHAATVAPVTRWIDPRLTTACVLFLMSVTLDSSALRAALLAPGAVLLACGMASVVLPLVAWGLMRLQLTPDFAMGLMITASVPSTLASASVMTRKAGGNDAVSLLTTLATNSLCWLVAPAWLLATTGREVRLDFAALAWSLVLAALLPTALGQAVRWFGRVRSFATRHKTGLSAAAQILIEVIVFTAALRAGATWHEWRTGDGGTGTPPTILATLVLLASVLTLHLGMLWVGREAGRLFGRTRKEQIAIAFSGSQKTLPVGLLVAADPASFGTLFPFAVFPLLVYHIAQLFLDSVIAGRWGMTKE
jgi:solute carrier family 10 (sodium/bile acid cotransporter), member 7